MSYENNLHRYFYHYIYRVTQLEKFRKYGRKYFSTEKAKEVRRKYLLKNPWVQKEHYKIAKKKWHEKNKGRRYAEYKIYRRENIFRMRARDQRRIALERGCLGVLTVDILQRVYEENIKKYGTLTCYLCLEPVKFKNDTLEHKTPLSRGGTNYYRNLAVACRRCNLSKRNKTLMEYKKYALLISAKSD